MHFPNTQRQFSSIGYNIFEYTTVCSIFDKDYRYGFNTQEKDNEIGIGHFTAEFWEYDSKLCRRWNLDPKPQIKISDYSVMGNNPIFNIDILGDEFTPNSRKEYRKQKHFAKSRERLYKRELKHAFRELRRDLKSNGFHNDATKARALEEDENKILSISIALSEVRSSLDELKEMKSSDEIFQIRNTRGGPVGQTRKLPSGVILIEWNGRDRSLLAHELKHGHQYINGEIDFLPNGNSGPSVDIYDEYYAYRRQIAFAFGRTLFLTTRSGNDLILKNLNLTPDLIRQIGDNNANYLLLPNDRISNIPFCKLKILNPRHLNKNPLTE
ncbi:MAG: hypothetical protein PSX81_08980 [bacterium]|nr:hypothetical protein [bacterium]